MALHLRGVAEQDRVLRGEDEVEPRAGRRRRLRRIVLHLDLVDLALLVAAMDVDEVALEGNLADLDGQAVLAGGRGRLQRRMLRPHVELHDRVAIDAWAELGQKSA